DTHTQSPFPWLWKGARRVIGDSHEPFSSVRSGSMHITHTHTHTRTHAHTNLHTHTHTRTHARTHAYTHMHAHTAVECHVKASSQGFLLISVGLAHFSFL